MVSFWIFKFHQNKDQESIEYKQIEDFDDFIYPELSICFLDPFFAKPFQELEGNLTTLDYQRYLVGEKEPNSINQNIDFSNQGCVVDPVFSLFHSSNIVGQN